MSVCIDFPDVERHGVKAGPRVRSTDTVYHLSLVVVEPVWIFARRHVTDHHIIVHQIVITEGINGVRVRHRRIPDRRDVLCYLRCRSEAEYPVPNEDMGDVVNVRRMLFPSNRLPWPPLTSVMAFSGLFPTKSCLGWKTYDGFASYSGGVVMRRSSGFTVWTNTPSFVTTTLNGLPPLSRVWYSCAFMVAQQWYCLFK